MLSFQPHPQEPRGCLRSCSVLQWHVLPLSVLWYLGLYSVYSSSHAWIFHFSSIDCHSEDTHSPNGFMANSHTICCACGNICTLGTLWVWQAVSQCVICSECLFPHQSSADGRPMVSPTPPVFDVFHSHACYGLGISKGAVCVAHTFCQGFHVNNYGWPWPCLNLAWLWLELVMWGSLSTWNPTSQPHNIYPSCNSVCSFPFHHLWHFSHRHPILFSKGIWIPFWSIHLWWYHFILHVISPSQHHLTPCHVHNHGWYPDVLQHVYLAWHACPCTRPCTMAASFWCPLVCNVDGQFLGMQVAPVLLPHVPHPGWLSTLLSSGQGWLHYWGISLLWDPSLHCNDLTHQLGRSMGDGSRV